jgi:hypothetical protein
MGAFLIELLSIELFGSGLGFCNNFGRKFGALFPAFVGSLFPALALASP